MSQSTQGEPGQDARKKSLAMQAWRECWWSADPIKGTLWLDFRLFQFTKSARQTINVRTANVKTSLTPIKFHQGHSKYAYAGVGSN